MFGSLGVAELLLIFAVILIVFGPRRIPEISRMLGKALGEFRKATDDIKSSIEREVQIEDLKQIAPQIVTPLESISRSGPTVEAPSFGLAERPRAADETPNTSSDSALRRPEDPTAPTE